MLKHRHIGIDILKIVAMLMVCVLHVNIWSKGLSSSISSAMDCPASWWWSVQLWQTLSICAVNLYAMATGYLCIAARWRLSRYLELWIQVAFYTLLGFGVGALLFHYHILDLEPLSGERYLSMLFPIPLANGYWYFSAYTALFFLMPFLNRCIQSIGKHALLSCLVILLIVFPILNQGNRLVFFDLGYNFTWLTIMYVTGAYARLHPLRCQTRYIVVAWLLVFGGHLAVVSFRPGIQVFYTALPVVLSSFLLFSVFTRIQWRGKLVGWVKWGATLSFGVYLIQLHPYFWDYMGKSLPECCIRMGYPLWLLPVVAFSMYMVFTLADGIRYLLFKGLRIKYLCSSVEKGLTSVWHKFISIIEREI